MSQNIINHWGILLDASTSMHGHAGALVKVVDAQVALLAERSRAEDQETRITLYTFSDSAHHEGHVAKCLVYDKDVLRMPSIAGMYRAHGNTALCDAGVKVIEDMRLTPVMYGDHSFLLMILTDGVENWSTPQGRREFPRLIREFADNWTLAALVPHALSVHQMKQLGVPAGNISVWDASSAQGMREVEVAMAAATDTYLSARASGQRSTQSLYMSAPAAAQVRQALVPLTPGSYFFLEVTPEDLVQVENGRIDQFMALKTGTPYSPGRAFYQMFKRERIQPYKRVAVAVQDKDGEHVYSGDNARQLLGLPDADVRVSPGRWKGYSVYILSTSMNRKLYPGTKVLVMR